MNPERWPVIGHAWAVESLARDLTAGRTRHAYLITGPEGIGKRTLATVFAQTALCDGESPPCGKCRHCTLISHGRHPDVSLLEPVVSGRFVKTAKITIEPIRQLIRDFSLRPLEASRRLAVITDFEAANPSAANALLKTLEEPPGDGILVLTATSEEALLPTIVSRCKRFALRPLARLVIRDALVKGWDAPPEHAYLLASVSNGRLGWAVGLLQNQDTLVRRSHHLADLRRLLASGRVERFAFAEQKSRDREALIEMLEYWQGWWRDVYLSGSGAATLVSNIDRYDEFQQAATHIVPVRAAKAIASIQRTLKQLERNANARLALEALLLQLPFIAA